MKLRPWRVCATLTLLLAYGLACAAEPAAKAATDAAATCLGAKESPEQSIDHCTAAAAEKLPDERRAAVLTRRGLAWFAKGELVKAGDDLDLAISLNAASAWTRNARGVVWMQKGDMVRAIDDFDAAVRLKPDYAFALANRGNAWLGKGDPERALADLDAALRLAPPQVELVHTWRGRAWLAKGELAQAGAAFEAALQANPRYANAVDGRGYVHFCQGDFDAAARDFAQEWQLRPDAESAVALIIARRRGGHDGKAELEEAAKRYGSDKGLPTALALLSGAVTPEQALQATADADANVQRQRVCTANFVVGEWHAVKGDAAQARQYLKVARESCAMSVPEYAAAGAELARLK